MWLPRGRGAEPQVEMTVAIAIGAPRHSREDRRMGSMSLTGLI
jgi:hypothetical protein